MPVVQYAFKYLLSICIISFSILFSSVNVFANVPELLAQGDNHRLMED